MQNTQEKFVISELIKYGYITRNFCLSKYISRLGAIICDLNKADWKIVSDYDHKGGDCTYTVVKFPKGVKGKLK